MELESLQFNGWTLFLGFAFGTIGFWLLKQAKQRSNFGLFGIGIVLMVYPYFVTNPWLCLLVGSALCFGAKKIWSQGY